MTSERQFSLFPKCGDELRSPLHGFKPIAGELADFGDSFATQVGDLVRLEISPDCLDRIEFRRIRWQPRDGNMSFQFFESGSDLAAAVGRHTVSDDL
jgi:hypothetical protein